MNVDISRDVDPARMNASPAIEYFIQYNETHLIETMRRYRMQRLTRFWFLPLKALCYFGMAALLALCLYARLWWLALLPGGFLLLLVFGSKLDDFIMKRRFRRSPFHGLDVSVRLTEQGFASVDVKTKVELAWSAFTGVRRFNDGFLAFTGPGAFYWWPDKALKIGTPGDVAELLRRHVGKFKG